VNVESSNPPAPVPDSGLAQALEPLRDRTYRRYWYSNALFTAGEQMQLQARQWLVASLTSSRTLIGAVGFLQGGVVLFISPIGGVLGDNVSQRNLLAWSRVGVLLLAILLGTLIATHTVAIWQIMVVSVFAGLIQGLSQPASQTFIYNLVGRNQLTRAIALNSVANGLTNTGGLALGGVLIGLFSVAGNFYLAAGIFAIALFQFMQLPEQGQYAAPARKRGNFFTELKGGFELAVHDKLIFAVVLLASTTLISTFPFALRVVVAKDVLHAGAYGFGILSAASALGSVSGAVAVAFFNTKRKGLALLIFSLIKEAATLVYGVSSSLWLSAAMDFVMGVYVAYFMTMIASLLQTEVPEHLRSRSISLFFMATSAAAFGSLVAGVFADWIGDRQAILLSGVVRGIIVLLIFLFLPALRRQGQTKAVAPAT